MTDKEQPEALILADELEAPIDGFPEATDLESKAAAELRRLHAENETLRAGYDAARLEIESLKAQATAAQQGAAYAALPDERDNFEKVFPLPSGCIRCGTGYASTGYSNWAAHTHCDRWVGWQARASHGQAPAGSVQEPAKLSDEQIKAHGDKASRMMARDLTRFDAACEVDKYLREQGAPGYYRHRMSIVLFGNAEGTEAARAPDTEPQPSPAAQGDALDTERLDFLIEHRAYVVSDDTCRDGYWLRFPVDGGTTSVQIGEYETPREAIDAARAVQEKT